MKVNDTERGMVELHATHQMQAKNNRRSSYHRQSVTVWVGSNIITSVPIFHEGHDNKGLIVEFIRTKEF